MNEVINFPKDSHFGGIIRGLSELVLEFGLFFVGKIDLFLEFLDALLVGLPYGGNTVLVGHDLLQQVLLEGQVVVYFLQLLVQLGLA